MAYYANKMSENEKRALNRELAKLERKMHSSRRLSLAYGGAVLLFLAEATHRATHGGDPLDTALLSLGSLGMMEMSLHAYQKAGAGIESILKTLGRR